MTCLMTLRFTYNILLAAFVLLYFFYRLLAFFAIYELNYTKLFSRSGFKILQLTNCVDLFCALIVVIVVAVSRDVR